MLKRFWNRLRGREAAMVMVTTEGEIAANPADVLPGAAIDFPVPGLGDIQETAAETVRRVSRLWRAAKRTLLAASGVTTAVCLWAFQVEPAMLLVRETPVQVETWPAAVSGLRVAVLADIHVGAPHIDLAKVREMVEKTNRSNPDVVVLLGDYVIHGVLGGRFVTPEEFAPILKDLKAPGGVYAVLGNHDWWYDGLRIRKAFEAAGITVLEDETRSIDFKGRRLWLAGLGDKWTRRADVEKTLKNIPAGEPIIALTHNPDLFPQIPARVGLTLAGHTHGGQVFIPFINKPFMPVKFRHPYIAGHVREAGRDLFVSPGIGTGAVPARLGVPPEIPVLTVESVS